MNKNISQFTVIKCCNCIVYWLTELYNLKLYLWCKLKISSKVIRLFCLLNVYHNHIYRSSIITILQSFGIWSGIKSRLHGEKHLSCPLNSWRTSIDLTLIRVIKVRHINCKITNEVLANTQKWSYFLLFSVS